MNLSKTTRIVQVLSPLAAEAATDRTSKVIDTEGFDSCLIVVPVGTIDGSADAQSIKLSHADAASDADTLTSGSDITGSAQAIASDADDNCFYIDVNDITKRFLQLTVDKDTTNNLNEAAVAILYNSKSSQPTTHGEGTGTAGGTGAVSGELITHPADGTA